MQRRCCRVQLVCYYGFGFTLRDDNGAVKAKVHGRTLEPADSFIVEALGCREALSRLKNAGIHNVVIESDCLLVIWAVNSQSNYQSYAGLMVNDTQALVKEIDACSLVFVKRSTNQEAHCLDKAAGSLPDSLSYFVDSSLIKFLLL